MNFMGAFPEQEQAAENEDQVAAGNAMRRGQDAEGGNLEERIGELDHKGQAAEQQDASHEREHQAGLPRLGLLFRGNLPARMEMKMMLSMPRMISSTVSVSRLTQISGELIQSIIWRGCLPENR